MWAALRVIKRPDNKRHGCARVILRATSVSMLVFNSLWQRATPVLQRAECNGTNNPNVRYTCHHDTMSTQTFRHVLFEIRPYCGAPQLLPVSCDVPACELSGTPGRCDVPTVLLRPALPTGGTA